MNPLPSKKQKLDQSGSEEEEGIDISSSDDSTEDDLNDDDEEDESDGGEGDTPADGMVNVEFEGVPPSEGDYDSVKRLLDQLFRGLLINTSNLSELVIQIQEYSTVLKDQDADEPTTFAVSTVVNLSNPMNHLALEAANEFRNRALEQYKEARTDSDAELQKFQIGGNKDSLFGLIVLEKIVNIPEQVAWKMLSTLKEDIEIEETKFSHFFMLTKWYRVGDEIHPVEEYFETLEAFSSLKLDLDLPDNVDTIQHNKGEGIPFRRLLLFKAHDFYQAIQTKTGV